MYLIGLQLRICNYTLIGVLVTSISVSIVAYNYRRWITSWNLFDGSLGFMKRPPK